MSDAQHPSAAVELLLAFTNSIDHELDTDELSTPDGLTTWLGERGLVAVGTAGTAGIGTRASADDLGLAHRLRDSLHGAFVAHHDGAGASGGATDPLETVAVDLPLRVTGAGVSPGLRPVDGGIRGGLAELLVAVMASVAEGSWGRLKICASSECAWAYYDASKNRSRVWCEWGCGNRIKTRNYRLRQKVSG